MDVTGEYKYIKCIAT